MKQYKKIMMAVLMAAITNGAVAQQTSRSAYFLEGATYRHLLNPAFMGERGYVSMPGLGNLYIGARTTAGVGDFIFKTSDGGLTTFMHESVGKKEFLNGLPNRVKLGEYLNEDILSIGFHAWGGFNTFGISIKSDASINMPNDLFKFMKDASDSHYQLKGINMATTNYAEIAFGHAREINDNLSVGIKAKALVGLAKATMRIKQLDIVATEDKWQITPQGAEVYVSGKGLIMPTKGEMKNYQEDDYTLDEEGNRTTTLKPGTDDQFSYDDIDFDDDNIGPTGFGMAFDLGAVYKLNDDWTFSASILDLGFISWKNTVKGSMSNSFEFNGFTEIPLKEDDDNKGNSLDNQADKIVDQLADMAKFTKDGEGMKRTTALAATMHFGAQYTLPTYDRLKFGLLSTTRLQGRHTWTEARISANISPISWFEMSANYALSNFGSAAGVMLNFNPRGFNFFIAADVPIGTFEPAYYAPINRAQANVNLGINFTFGPKHKRKYKTVEVQSL